VSLAFLRRWRQICYQTMRTTIVSQTSGYIAPVLPIILCAPKFLEGSMSLGQVMQAASAFTIVQAAFNWLVDNYPRLADWTASAPRVASVMVSFDALERAEEGEGVGRIERRCGTAALRSFGHARYRQGRRQGRRGREDELAQSQEEAAPRPSTPTPRRRDDQAQQHPEPAPWFCGWRSNLPARSRATGQTSIAHPFQLDRGHWQSQPARVSA
jgi:hypothetical protein